MNGSGLVIRSADPSDFDQLCEVYCHSVKCNPKGFIQDPAFHGCIIQKTRQWRKTGGDMLVAVLNKKVVGLGALAPQSAHRAELCKLHVDSEWQGRGIGRHLAGGLVQYAYKAGFAEVELHVTATQSAAIALYRSLGFRETGRKVFTATVFGVAAFFDTIYMEFPLTEGCIHMREVSLPVRNTDFAAGLS